MLADDLLAEVQEIQRQLDALPPVPKCIIASRKVPYGRAPRMWNTRGELIVYANRGEIAGLPHRKAEPVTAGLSIVRPGAFGIPVYIDG